MATATCSWKRRTKPNVNRNTSITAEVLTEALDTVARRIEGTMTGNFKTLLNAGFAELRKRGYFAKQNWQLCQSLGLDAIPDDVTDYVFYHQQDTWIMAEEDSVCLSWHGDGREIAKVFRGKGLAIDWDGSDRCRICVKAAEPQPDQHRSE
jgi:hypothetical protein